MDNESEEQKPQRVNVEFLDDKWVVKNQGDSSILYSANDKESCEKFANQIADSYDLDMKVFAKDKNSNSPTEAPQPLEINVERRNDEWQVKKSGHDEVLFRSQDKDEAVRFANSIEHEHGLDLHIDN